MMRRREGGGINAEARRGEIGIWREQARLLACSPEFQCKLKLTKDCIKNFVKNFCDNNPHNCVISYSYGKDSTVMLHLARTIFPDMSAVHILQGAEIPDVTIFRENFPVKLGPIINLKADITFEDGAEQFGWWGKSKQTKKRFSSSKWNRAMFTNPMNRFYDEKGIKGVLVGIRSEESRNRAALGSILSKDKVQRTTDPPRVYPIIDWSVEDIWAYIGQFDVPYCQAYDREVLGVSRYSIRISPVLAAGGHLSHGVVAWLRICYPIWFAKMKREYPNWGALA